MCTFNSKHSRLSQVDQSNWQCAGALEAAKEAARAADPEDVRPRILLGNIYWAAGQASQASKEYQAALRAGPTSCPLDLYLRLGTAFLAEGEFEYARNVYVQVHSIAAAAYGMYHWSGHVGQSCSHVRLHALTKESMQGSLASPLK